MPLHDKIIPREISDFTREVEDFVRPVTDPVRSFIAKAVPREIKPVLPFIASSMVPLPFMNFPGGQFLGGFGLDALTQKLMTDPEDEDTDIDYLSALMSGVARSTAAAAKKPQTEQRFADPADYGMETVSGQRPGDSFLVSDPSSPRSQYVKNMFDIAYEVNKKVNSAKEYKGRKFRTYRKDNAIYFEFEKTIAKSVRRYRKLNKQRKEMLDSTVLSSEEKTKREEQFDTRLFNISKDVVNKFSERVAEKESNK